MLRFPILLLWGLILAVCVVAEDNGVGRTPVMGVSGYNALMQGSGKCDKAGASGYNETTFLQWMDVLVNSAFACGSIVLRVKSVDDRRMTLHAYNLRCHSLQLDSLKLDTRSCLLVRSSRSPSLLRLPSACCITPYPRVSIARR